MRKTVLLLCILGVLASVAAGVGLALPSLGGPTGIVSVPTAQVLPMNDVEAALSYQIIKLEGTYDSGSSANMAVHPKALAPQRADSLDSPFGTDRLRVWSLQGLAGISERTEAWASFGSVRDGSRENVWGIGLKSQVPTKLLKQSKNTALAVGGSFQNWDDVGSAEKLYLTATTDLRTFRKPAQTQPSGLPVYGTLGLLWLRAEPEHGSSETLLRPFLGAEAAVGQDTTLGAEYRFSDDSIDAKAIWSFVLRHAFDQTFSAEIGTTNASPVGTGMDSQGMFVRVGYHFPD